MKLKGSRSNLIEKEINSAIVPRNSLTAHRSKAVFGAFMPELSSHSPKNVMLFFPSFSVWLELILYRISCIYRYMIFASAEFS